MPEVNILHIDEGFNEQLRSFLFALNRRFALRDPYIRYVPSVPSTTLNISTCLPLLASM